MNLLTALRHTSSMKRILLISLMVCLLLVGVGVSASTLWRANTPEEATRTTASRKTNGGNATDSSGQATTAPHVATREAAKDTPETKVQNTQTSNQQKSPSGKKPSATSSRNPSSTKTSGSSPNTPPSTGTPPSGSTSGSSTPPVASRATYIGACPANPGGASAAAASTVITKWGSGAAVRQFFGSDLSQGPHHPAGASIVHSSFKPSVSAVNSGSLDDQIRALIARTPAGDIIEFHHEPDNDGLDAAGIADMIAAKNRLYTLKQQVKPSVKVAATMTGGFFANYTSEAKRIPWYGLKGDLVGLDADGVHDATGPTYDMTYADEIAGVKTFTARDSSWKGWTVPEHGTSRQPWDTTGSARANWFRQQIQLFIDNGAYAVMLYNYNTSSHNTATDYNQVKVDTPEYTIWRDAIQG